MDKSLEIKIKPIVEILVDTIIKHYRSLDDQLTCNDCKTSLENCEDMPLTNNARECQKFILRKG